MTSDEPEITDETDPDDLTGNEANHPTDTGADMAADNFRLVEAALFASREPLTERDLKRLVPDADDLPNILERLEEDYRHRGVQLVQRGRGWAFRTAPDLAERMRVEADDPKRLSRAAIETLAIIAYHQPVTRAEIESIRGVATSRGSLDQLMEAGWVQPGKRRETPGRPLTWVTTAGFLDHFNLMSLSDLPGVKDLEAAGLLDKRPAVEAFGGRGNDPDSLQPEPAYRDGDEPDDVEDDWNEGMTDSSER